MPGNPADLAPYGLETPSAEVVLKDRQNTLHLFVGAEDREGNVYVKEAGSDTVVSVIGEGLDFLDTPPFELMDKFALIIDIDFVDRLVLSAGNKQYTAEIVRAPATADKDEEPAAEYFLNKKPVEERIFKQFYQKMIGLLFEAENPSPGKSVSGKVPAVTIAYELNIPEKHAEISFYNFNRDFYSAVLRGSSGFLISKSQLDSAVTAAVELVK